MLVGMSQTGLLGVRRQRISEGFLEYSYTRTTECREWSQFISTLGEEASACKRLGKELMYFSCIRIGKIQGLPYLGLKSFFTGTRTRA